MQLLFYSCPAVNSDENAVLTNVNPHTPFNDSIIFSIRVKQFCTISLYSVVLLHPLILYTMTDSFWLQVVFSNKNIRIQMYRLQWALISRITLEKRHFRYITFTLCVANLKKNEIWDQKLMINHTYWSMYTSRSITSYDDSWNASVDMVTLHTITFFTTS